MIKSMTGYGRGETQRDGLTLVAELRAVNNRYLDCGVRIPRLYLFAEDAIKGRVQGAISRGKVDVFVTVDASAADVTQVTVNRELAAQYAAALRELQAKKAEFPDLSSPAINAAYPGRCQSLTQVLSTTDARLTALSRQPEK